MENIKVNRMQKIAMALFAVGLLQGCVQYSDTLNRPQPMVFAPADGGTVMPVFDATAGRNMANPALRADDPRVKYHPNIIAHYENSYDYSDMDINVLEHIDVAYQDKDVALVTNRDLPMPGSGGYMWEVVDLRGAPKEPLYMGLGSDGKIVRKGSKVIFTYNARDRDSKTGRRRERQVIDLNKIRP